MKRKRTTIRLTLTRQKGSWALKVFQKEFQCAFLETYHGIDGRSNFLQKIAQHSLPKYHEMSLKLRLNFEKVLTKLNVIKMSLKFEKF